MIRSLNNLLRSAFGGSFVVSFNTRHVINKFHCFFSNLMGPTEKLRIAGVGIERLSNFVHPMNYSLGVSIQSYAGDIVVNFSSDKGMVPDPDVIGRMADEAFRDICKEAKGGVGTVEVETRV